MDPFQKFLPGVLERFELPRWFIDMADQRSRGKLKFIVFDHANENLIHADYYIGENYLETKIFEVRMKDNKNGKEKDTFKGNIRRGSQFGQ